MPEKLLIFSILRLWVSVLSTGCDSGRTRCLPVLIALGIQTSPAAPSALQTAAGEGGLPCYVYKLQSKPRTSTDVCPASEQKTCLRNNISTILELRRFFSFLFFGFF